MMPIGILLGIVFALAGGAARADSVKSLNRGDQSLAAMYAAISAAKKTIDVATYVIEPCGSSANFLLNEILKKTKEPSSKVKARIVIDSYLLKEPHRSGLASFLSAQSNRNIEVKIYGTSPGLDRPRNHSKVLVVDGETLVVGGRNWTDDYFGLGTKINYLDQDLLITGSAARDAGKYFNELWKASDKAPISGKGESYASCLAPQGRAQALAQFIQSNAVSILNSRPTRSCATDFEMDDPMFMSGTPGDDGAYSGDYLSGERLVRKRTTKLVLDFVKGTQRKISLTNQYYFPWLLMDNALAELREKEFNGRKRGVEVFTNATGDIDDMPSHNTAFTCYIQYSAYKHYSGSQKVVLLSQKGIMKDPWQLSPNVQRWRIHTKTAIRDDRDVLVSSWNIDPRSYHTNLETGVVVRNCPGLASDLYAQYKQLSDFSKLERNCPSCQAEVVKSNASNNPMCGGLPQLY